MVYPTGLNSGAEGCVARCGSCQVVTWSTNDFFEPHPNVQEFNSMKQISVFRSMKHMQIQSADLGNILADVGLQADLIDLARVAKTIDAAISTGSMLVAVGNQEEQSSYQQKVLDMLINQELAVIDCHGSVRLTSICCDDVVLLSEAHDLWDKRLEDLCENLNLATTYELQSTLVNAGFSFAEDHERCSAQARIMMRTQCVEYYRLILQSTPDKLESREVMWHNQRRGYYMCIAGGIIPDTIDLNKSLDFYTKLMRHHRDPANNKHPNDGAARKVQRIQRRRGPNKKKLRAEPDTNTALIAASPVSDGSCESYSDSDGSSDKASSTSGDQRPAEAVDDNVAAGSDLSSEHADIEDQVEHAGMCVLH